jgi:hypothetical protein
MAVALGAEEQPLAAAALPGFRLTAGEPLPTSFVQFVLGPDGPYKATGIEADDNSGGGMWMKQQGRLDLMFPKARSQQERDEALKDTKALSQANNCHQPPAPAARQPQEPARTQAASTTFEVGSYRIGSQCTHAASAQVRRAHAACSGLGSRKMRAPHPRSSATRSG